MGLQRVRHTEQITDTHTACEISLPSLIDSTWPFCGLNTSQNHLEAITDRFLVLLMTDS